MYCPNCGKENPDGNRFCIVCGKELGTFSQEPFEEQQDNSNLETPDSSKASKQGFFHKPAGKVLIVVIIAAAIVAVIIAVMWRHSTKGLVDTEIIEEEEVPINETSDIVYDVNNLSEEQRNMLGPMDTLIYVGYEVRDTTEQWDDPSYFWGCIWFLIGNYRDLFIDSGHAVIDPNLTYGVAFTEDLVKECASALFPDFTGELPSINDISVSSIYKEGDYYHVGIGDRGEGGGLYISSWTEYSDGRSVVEVKHMDDEGNPVENSATHIFELVKNQYTQSESDPIYVYTIASRTTIDGDSSYAGADAVSYYILPDSDTRYYTEDELRALTQDELRLARNEIYARHGRMFDAQDLQTYFESQPWYRGTIEPADFSDNMLNDYEKANIKTIQAMENKSDNTGTSVQTTQNAADDDTSFAKSWEVIQNYGMYNGDWLYHNYGENNYTYSNLAFDVKQRTLEDMGDYYFAQAVFEKPLTITDDLNPGEKYVVYIDELNGIARELTCYEGEYGLYLLDEYGEIYSIRDKNSQNSYELWYDTDDLRYAAFYEGVLRIRKDAVTGAAISYGPYNTVSISVLQSEYSVFDGVAFDENGYVTQLLFLGD